MGRQPYICRICTPRNGGVPVLKRNCSCIKATGPQRGFLMGLSAAARASVPSQTSVETDSDSTSDEGRAHAPVSEAIVDDMAIVTATPTPAGESNLHSAI